MAATQCSKKHRRTGPERTTQAVNLADCSRQTAETELMLSRKTAANKNRPLIRVTITADHGPLDSTGDTAKLAEVLAKTQQRDRTF